MWRKHSTNADIGQKGSSITARGQASEADTGESRCNLIAYLDKVWLWSGSSVYSGGRFGAGFHVIGAAGTGLRDPGVRRLRAYVSSETHTWILKAADLFGFGTDYIRWIAVDERQRINIAELRRQIEKDLVQGHKPFLVVGGTAGSVSTGAWIRCPSLQPSAGNTACGSM